ncbi:DUF4352 domain-containing protein [Streptomyces sp. NPDC002994]|uniref:DUF4352 domain-containing protein n=1 Tax=Streptomyces sp. NPDC002994 TaxID=3154441 RepID=UPI0033A0C8D3
MSYQNQPQQPPQQPPPGWGQPPMQPPGWGQPPMPPRKNNAGKIVGFSCLGIVGAFVLLAILGSLVSSGGDTTAKSGGKTAVASEKPTKAAEKAEKAEKEEAAEKPKKADPKPKPEPAAAGPVKVSAKKATFTPGVLHDGGKYTSVSITIANNGDKPINVNPLYFSITDTNGTKHTAELAKDERQIDTVDLAPGENITGVVTGEGEFTAKYVTYTDGLFGDPVRGNVS